MYSEIASAHFFRHHTANIGTAVARPAAYAGNIDPAVPPPMGPCSTLWFYLIILQWFFSVSPKPCSQAPSSKDGDPQREPGTEASFLQS